MMGVYYVKQMENQERVFSVYTDKCLFIVREFGGVEVHPHVLGMIPIVEYPLDDSRLGIWEVAKDLFDAIDKLQSNRMDDVVQVVNSFLAILGGELNEETYQKLNEWKTLCLPEGVDAKYLSPAMNQGDVQTLKDDLYQAALVICGVPNRNGGSSTSDTGAATIVRDGWSAAEGRAKIIETSFKEAEKQSLKLDLRILRDTVGTGLKLSDIDIHFTRRNYENIASKSQVLVAMLNNPKIHPELAFAHCGMFADSESAYLQSKAWWEEQEEKQKKELERNANLGRDSVS
jgi:SPP1 family phage portal protein